MTTYPMVTISQHNIYINKNEGSGQIKVSRDDKLIEIARFNTELNAVLGTTYNSFKIYKSQGLLTHLLKRKHYTAAKYIENLPDIIREPDFAGVYNGNIELVKCYKDNIFISIKLDTKKSKHYVATIFDVKRGKIEAYMKLGRWKEVGKQKELDWNSNQ
ncbi:MAG: hypothetical protein PUB19_01155 [Lachnospiraceae bacterium]|nr:hypothetical protein [Lachnospiraceae bacterium]